MLRNDLSIVGQRFGRLVCLNRVNRPGKNSYWRFKCDCGKEIVTSRGSVTSGNSKSCGCLRAECTSRRLFKHGLGKSRVYRIWRHMHSRCYNKKVESYKWYGAKGIRVCKRWHDFKNFLADMGTHPTATSIDRLDGTKGYFKINCKWSTHGEQAANRSDTAWHTMDGKKKALVTWSKEYGVPQGLLWWRLNSGWPIKEALNIKPHKRKKRVY